jgi:DNA-binding NarL/FixJ family response regulator
MASQQAKSVLFEFNRLIVFTNYRYPQYRKKCMDLGADFFFAKATESDKIPLVVSELIQGSRD